MKDPQHYTKEENLEREAFKLARIKSRIDKLRSCLRWALGQAEQMRGAFLPEYQAQEIAEFDKRVQKCKDALKDR